MADLTVLPGPTTVGVAAARLARSWEEATVVSFVGRDEATALAALEEALGRRTPTVCLLRPGQDLEAIASRVRAARAASWLLSGLGSAAERVRRDWMREPLAPEEPSVLWVEHGPRSPRATARRPLTLDVFAPRPRHSDGVFSQLDVRLALVARLGPEQLRVGARVLEVGAGSGYVGLTLLRVRPDVSLVQLEPRPERAEAAAANAREAQVRVEVRRERIEDHDPGATYDAAIVGGGGLAALRAALERVRVGGRVVASYVDPGRAAHARELLGNVAMLALAEGVATPPDGVRFVPKTPIFLAWGEVAGRRRDDLASSRVPW